MKKILIIAVAVLSMTACKKTYTCDCTTTTTISFFGQDTSVTSKTSSSAYDAKMTKTQAQAACDHEAITISSTEKNNIDASGASGFVTIIPTTKCTLE